MTPKERSAHRSALVRLRAEVLGAGPAKIAPKRLAAVPYATLCIACQAKRDPKLGASRKKLTDFR